MPETQTAVTWHRFRMNLGFTYHNMSTTKYIYEFSMHRKCRCGVLCYVCICLSSPTFFYTTLNMVGCLNTFQKYVNQLDDWVLTVICCKMGWHVTCPARPWKEARISLDIALSQKYFSQFQSPVETVQDFFLWYLLKGRVFKVIHHTVKNLKRNTANEMNEFFMPWWLQHSWTWIIEFVCVCRWGEGTFSIFCNPVIACTKAGIYQWGHLVTWVTKF